MQSESSIASENVSKRGAERLRSMIGVGILVAAIIASFWNVIFRNVQKVTSDQIEIRIGHAELHTGMREAFQAAIEAYQDLHPNVRIIQVPVPPRTYPAWIRTQLVGGTAPDIVPLDGEISQFFLPLTSLTEQPNPYNVGTNLEGIPWRDTFFDGLSAARDRLAFSAPGQVFGVNLQTVSMRLYINRDMLIEITGSDSVPEVYNDLYELSQKIKEYNQRTGKKIIPIAGCRQYSDYIFDRVVGSQMQKFLLDYNPHMQPWGFFRPMADKVFTYSETPEFMSSLELLHEVSQMLTPGYLQFGPEDAIAAYLQQRSLMLVAGSWDYAVLVDRVPFETAITTIPMPSTDDPRYGQFSLGQAAETVGTTSQYGVVRASPHAEVAADFLLFLTSLPTATQFSDISKRISAIIDVPVAEELALMAAKIDGEIPGFRVDTFLSRLNTSNLFNQHIHKVFDRNPDIRGFAATIDAQLLTYLKEDIKVFHRSELTITRKFDGQIVLYYMLPENHPERVTWLRYLEEQSASQGRYIGYNEWLRTH